MVKPVASKEGNKEVAVAGVKPAKIPAQTKTPKTGLEGDVENALKGAVKPSDEAIQAALAREKAEAGEAETKGKGAGQAGKKRGPYKAGKTGVVSTLSAQTEADKVKGYRMIGYAVADTLILGGVTLGGSDWNPVLAKNDKGETVYDEKENLRNAWADMAEYYEWQKFPPWLGVTLATAAYVGPRLMAPSTQARVSKVKLWYDAWKLKRQEKKAAKEAAKNA